MAEEWPTRSARLALSDRQRIFSGMPEPLPRPAPGGLCTSCRDALYFERSGIVGQAGTLWCKRCRLRFRWLEQEQWDPFRDRPPLPSR